VGGDYGAGFAVEEGDCASVYLREEGGFFGGPGIVEFVLGLFEGSGYRGAEDVGFLGDVIG